MKTLTFYERAYTNKIKNVIESQQANSCKTTSNNCN